MALEYKNKWTYFFFGLGSYYGGTIIAGFIVGIVLGFNNGFDSVVDDDFINPGWKFFIYFLEV